MFFKINEPIPEPTAREELLTGAPSATTLRNRRWWWVEAGLVCAGFLVWGGWIPAVNETHYLARAKGFWDPNWCPEDLFVHAPAAHWTFYLLFGWLTQLLSLPATALVGRLAAAILLAVGWTRLVWAIRPRPGLAVVASWIFLLFTGHFHLAGEWMVGGVEAKCFAWFFVLLALEAMVLRHSSSIALWIGLATACHVLVGG